MIGLFALAIFAIGPGLGVALAIHLQFHEESHACNKACCCQEEDPPHPFGESHDSSNCLICVQLTTNAKSPTIQVISLLIVSDGPAVVDDIPDQQIYTSRGFSAASPRAPPLA